MRFYLEFLHFGIVYFSSALGVDVNVNVVVIGFYWAAAPPCVHHLAIDLLINGTHGVPRREDLNH